MPGNGADLGAAPMMTLAEAMVATGRSRDALRGLIRRGRVAARRSNDGRTMVAVPAWLLADQGATGAPPTLDQGATTLRDQLLHAVERAARAEGEAAALRDALADLAGRLDRAEQRLAAPWWSRLFAGR